MVYKKCGPSNGFDAEMMSRRDAVLAGLSGAGGLYRVGGSQEVNGVAQCVGDLSMGKCQDCIGEAINRLKTECGGALFGDMFLGKCYARYTTNGAHAYAAKSNHGKQATNFFIINWFIKLLHINTYAIYDCIEYLLLVIIYNDI